MESRLNIADLSRDIVGADRGFNVGADVLTRTVDGVSYATLHNEIVDTLALQNKGRQAVSALFTSTTTDAFDQIAKEPGKGESFELASEFGVPQATRRGVEYFRMGYPIEFYDLATRYTEKFLRDATADQVRLQLANVLEADNRLVFGLTMRALTNKTTSGSRLVNENGQTVYDLWDGSAGEVPPSFGGKTFSSSHDHYLVSGAASIDSGDVEALVTTIQEHGYGLRQSGERVVIMAHPNQSDAIWSWRRGQANANGAIARFDFIPAQGTPAFLSAEDVIGDVPAGTFNGLDIEGSYGDALITKNYLVPDGYIIALASAGPNRERNPLRFREHVNPEWRGLLLRQHVSHPLRDSYHQRGFGVGVRHRGAAAVMQIKASGSYTSPTWPI